MDWRELALPRKGGVILEAFNSDEVLAMGPTERATHADAVATKVRLRLWHASDRVRVRARAHAHAVARTRCSPGHESLTCAPIRRSCWPLNARAWMTAARRVFARPLQTRRRRSESSGEAGDRVPPSLRNCPSVALPPGRLVGRCTHCPRTRSRRTRHVNRRYYRTNISQSIRVPRRSHYAAVAAACPPACACASPSARHRAPRARAPGGARAATRASTARRCTRGAPPPHSAARPPLAAWPRTARRSRSRSASDRSPLACPRL